MASDVEKLMRHIIRQYLAREDAIDIDRDATAGETGSAIAEDKQRATKEEETRAQELTRAFQAGLQRADAAHRAGGSAISLDDRKEDEDIQADAMVNFLVRAKLATSNTRETTDRHYIYTISVDWNALRRVAKEARANLESILRDT